MARLTMFAWPRATFAAVFVLVEFLFFDIFVQQRDVVSLFLEIYRSRWFLRTLGVLYVLSAAIYRLGKTDRRRWLLFGTAYLSLLILPARFRHCLSFAGGNQLVQMFPYFVFGLMALRICRRPKFRFAAWGCLFVFLAVILQEGLCKRIGLSTWTAPAVTWRSLVLHDTAFLHLAARTILGILGTVGFLALAEKIITWFPPLSRLAPLGTTTMGVYIVHERPLYIAAAYGFSLPASARLPLTILLFGLCHLFVLLIRKHPLWNTAFFGSENLLSRFYQRFVVDPAIRAVAWGTALTGSR